MTKRDANSNDSQARTRDAFDTLDEVDTLEAPTRTAGALRHEPQRKLSNTDPGLFGLEETAERAADHATDPGRMPAPLLEENLRAFGKRPKLVAEQKDVTAGELAARFHAIAHAPPKPQDDAADSAAPIAAARTATAPAVALPTASPPPATVAKSKHAGAGGGGGAPADHAPFDEPTTPFDPRKKKIDRRRATLIKASGVVIALAAFIGIASMATTCKRPGSNLAPTDTTSTTSASESSHPAADVAAPSQKAPAPEASLSSNAPTPASSTKSSAPTPSAQPPTVRNKPPQREQPTAASRPPTPTPSATSATPATTSEPTAASNNPPEIPPKHDHFRKL